MKFTKYFLTIFITLNISASAVAPKNNLSETSNENSLMRKLTIEPAIGINPWPISDLLLTNLVQWNLKKHLSIVSHSSYSYNNAFDRDFNYIKTNYNYSLSQKFGVGASLYSKRSSHTISFMAGVKYNSYKETLHNPEFDEATASVNLASPDFGLMYNLKVGKGKYFFSYRMYLPLYPYPFKTTDINSIDGNFATLSMEFGIGIRLK